MSDGQILPGQMSLWHLESVQHDPRNLRLKFCQNRFGNSWDITDIEFSGGSWWWVVVVVCRVIFVSNPTLGYVRLNWGWVGVLTIFIGPKTFPGPKNFFFIKFLYSNFFDLNFLWTENVCWNKKILTQIFFPGWDGTRGLKFGTQI